MRRKKIEGTEAAHDEVMPTKSPSPLGWTFFSPSHSPSPLQQRFSLAGVTNAPHRVQHGSLQELKELRETVSTLKERLAEMEKSAQCTSPPFPSWPAMSLPGNFPPNFPPNPWAYGMSAMMPFSPTPVIASAGFETPKSSFSATVAAYDDDVEFDDAFSHYGSASPLKIRR